MTLNTQVAAALKTLTGAPMPHTLALSADKQIDIEIEFTAVDSMSCAVREVRLHVPAAANASFDVLRAWAERLATRITYLLEHVGPLEFDPDHGRVLIRSTSPDQQDGAKRYYEAVLHSKANGNFTLRRFRYEKGGAGREQVDMALTHEVVAKLLDDLVETAPAAA